MDRKLVNAAAWTFVSAGLLAWMLPAPAQEQQQQRPMASESLRKVREIIDNWGEKSWDEVLAEDVSLSLRIADMVRQADGSSTLVSLRTELRGREKVKQALQKLYQGYHKRVTITSEILSGNQAVLIGEVKPMGRKAESRQAQQQDGRQAEGARPKGREAEGEYGQEQEGRAQADTVPVAIHMRFNPEGKIDRLAIASFDLKAAGPASGGPPQEQQSPEQK